MTDVMNDRSGGGEILDRRQRLKGRRVLVVDDEPDVLGALESLLLEICAVDTASDFESARRLLKEKAYDLAILDIMGVKGFELLEITAEKNIPTVL